MRAKAATTEEPIWEGRLHMGDEPGIYGNATYAGLAMNLPVTLHPFDPAGTDQDITFILTANRIKIYQGYDGHIVTVFAYDEVQPLKWARRELLKLQMKDPTFEIPNVSVGNSRHLSIQVKIATDAAPGLYDDFILRSLTLKSTTHYADFGFR